MKSVVDGGGLLLLSGLFFGISLLVEYLMPTLFAVLAPAGFWLLFTGGLCYTLGAVFYVLKKVKFMHSIFHVFVLAGSILQFLSVYLFVI